MRAGNVLLQIDSISLQEEAEGWNPGGADTFCCKIALGREKILCTSGSYPLEQLRGNSRGRLEFHVEPVEPVEEALLLLVCNASKDTAENKAEKLIHTKEVRSNHGGAIAFGIINVDGIRIGDKNSLETVLYANDPTPNTDAVSSLGSGRQIGKVQASVRFFPCRCSCKSRDELGRERINGSIFDANLHSPRKSTNTSTTMKSQPFTSNQTKRIDRVSPKYPFAVRAL